MSEGTRPRIIACPACGKATAYSASNRWRPFCSERCRTTDLGGWASESYRIPVSPNDEEPGNSPDDPPIG